MSSCLLLLRSFIARGKEISPPPFFSFFFISFLFFFLGGGGARWALLKSALNSQTCFFPPKSGKSSPLKFNLGSLQWSYLLHFFRNNLSPVGQGCCDCVWNWNVRQLSFESYPFLVNGRRRFPEQRYLSFIIITRPILHTSLSFNLVTKACLMSRSVEFRKATGQTPKTFPHPLF